MTTQPNTGSMDLTAIPTKDIARSVQFLSQIMMGQLGQEAALLVSMLSQLSAHETSLMMKQTRAGARDSLIGGVIQAAGEVGSGITQGIAGAKISAEGKIQGDAKKAYDLAKDSSPASKDVELVETAAKMDPEKARETYEQTRDESNVRIKSIEKNFTGVSEVTKALTGLGKTAMEASSNLEKADSQLAGQVAQHLMQVLNSIVSNVTSDFASNKPYASAVALAA